MLSSTLVIGLTVLQSLPRLAPNFLPSCDSPLSFTPYLLLPPLVDAKVEPPSVCEPLRGEFWLTALRRPSMMLDAQSEDKGKKMAVIVRIQLEKLGTLVTNQRMDMMARRS